MDNFIVVVPFGVRDINVRLDPKDKEGPITVHVEGIPEEPDDDYRFSLDRETALALAAALTAAVNKLAK